MLCDVCVQSAITPLSRITVPVGCGDSSSGCQGGKQRNGIRGQEEFQLTFTIQLHPCETSCKICCQYTRRTNCWSDKVIIVASKLLAVSLCIIASCCEGTKQYESLVSAPMFHNQNTRGLILLQEFRLAVK